MDTDLVEKILKYKRSGATVMFRHTSIGQQRVKLRYGPAGLLTKRFDVDNETAQALKERMSGTPVDAS